MPPDSISNSSLESFGTSLGLPGDEQNIAKGGFMKLSNEECIQRYCKGVLMLQGGDVLAFSEDPAPIYHSLYNFGTLVGPVSTSESGQLLAERVSQRTPSGILYTVAIGSAWVF
jgi:hypothetical protein